MNLHKQNLIIMLWILGISPMAGCKKDFLNQKPSTNIVIPSTLTDMAQLLDHQTLHDSSPSMGIMSGDEYYFRSLDAYNSLVSKTEKNCYTWNTNIYQGEVNIPDWNMPYLSIFYSNVVLDQWEKLNDTEKNSDQGKFIKAWALFSRSYAFYNLVQIFSPAYNQPTATRDLGIPIKLTADINDIQPRATVQQTYDRIISDLESSVDLYTDAIPVKNPNRPSKAAVFAFLSRVYLSMREYTKAADYADKALSITNYLIDYNEVDTSLAQPFDLVNKEVLFSSGTYYTYAIVLVAIGSATADPTLVNLYDKNDLRKSIFFNKINDDFLFKGGYTGFAYYPFTGLATDEIYLIKAECYCRSGNLPLAVQVLNSLLIKRYKKDTYTPFKSSEAKEILEKILTERRKELVWRGLRWSDLKRLNIEGANITLKRLLNGIEYTLPPNDSRYVMPIPDDELALSHIIQNDRNKINNQ